MRKQTVVNVMSLLLTVIMAANLPLVILASAAPEVPNGPWLDEVVWIKEGEAAKVVDMLSKGDIHAYFIDVRADPKLVERIKADPNIGYKYAYGLYFEITSNPVGPEFRDGTFNPFSNPRIREALNWLIDRNYIVDEIHLGFARPKWFPLISAFPDYAKLADVVKMLEAKYSYNFELAKTVIFEEMVKMGCEYKDGKWFYKGKEVVIKSLIRVEDQRRQIGDYVSDQLEKLGFKTERMYKTSREAAPIWLRGNPADGQWHIYTGGWITTAVDRDAADVWAFFYTPLGRPEPLWQAYKPDPLFYEVARRLWDRAFKTIEERQELMAKAAEMAIKDSVRVWVVDQIVPYLYRKDVTLAADLSGGFATALWSRTARFVDRVGGSFRAGNREVLVDPWNPVAGSNWVYDAVIQTPLVSYAFLTNPYTGLPMPERVVNVTLFVEKGVDTIYSSDWLTVKFVDKVEVPPDAWWGYDVAAEKLVTAGEAGVKAAKVRVVANYGDVIGKIRYHDGTMMTLADWIVTWPLTFHRVDPKSPLYDAAAVPGFQSWRPLFAGRRILSTSPLVVEWYGNYTHPEAEFIVTYFAGWPNMPWHTTAIGIRAEEKGLLAFSTSKADKMKVEWMNYIGGPSLKILEETLKEMIDTGYIPFSKFASAYVSVDEAKARYQALMNWYKERKHFWVGDGPFYLDSVDYMAHTAVLKANRNHPDKADRWAWLADPPIPEVKIEVPENVIPGIAADINVRVSFKGQPYPAKRIEFVKYLVLDASGNVMDKGEAKAVSDGLFKISLSSEATGKFTPGTYKILTFTLSKDVAMPATVEASFLAISQIAYMSTLLGRTEARISSLEQSLNARLSEVENRLNALSNTVNIVMALAAVALLLSIVVLALPFIKKQKSQTLPPAK
ncbi:MAG: ABC transporter substrate-binding protein [Thermofilaceae archaeon]|nr:ABC transporter substrate-binding protein [Thermofilaceae archaeon]